MGHLRRRKELFTGRKVHLPTASLEKLANDRVERYGNPGKDRKSRSARRRPGPGKALEPDGVDPRVGKAAHGVSPLVKYPIDRLHLDASRRSLCDRYRARARRVSAEVRRRQFSPSIGMFSFPLLSYDFVSCPTSRLVLPQGLFRGTTPVGQPENRSVVFYQHLHSVFFRRVAYPAILVDSLCRREFAVLQGFSFCSTPKYLGV